MTTIANGFCLWIAIMWLIIVLSFILIKRKPTETEKKRF